MALETLSWDSPPALTDGDDGENYNMGAECTVVEATLCHGIEWYVPDTVVNPTSGTHVAALWHVDSTTRIATEDFTPVPGTIQVVTFDAPVTMLPGETYIAAVLTRHYSFRTPDPPAGWVVATPSGNVLHQVSRLSATADPNTMPGGSFNAWYYISPVVDAPGGGPAPVPDGVAIPFVLGTPAVGDAAAVQPSGLPVPIALGTPTVGGAEPSPTGLGIPLALGSPAVGIAAAVQPDGVALPISLGVPAVDAVTAGPDGLAIPFSLGTPAVGLAAAVQPDGVAIPIGLGTPTIGAIVTPNGVAIPIALGTPAVGPTTLITHLPPMTGTAAVTAGPSGTATLTGLTGTATIT